MHLDLSSMETIKHESVGRQALLDRKQRYTLLFFFFYPYRSNNISYNEMEEFIMNEFLETLLVLLIASIGVFGFGCVLELMTIAERKSRKQKKVGLEERISRLL